MVDDVQALDGLYIRIAIPALGRWCCCRCCYGRCGRPAPGMRWGPASCCWGRDRAAVDGRGGALRSGGAGCRRGRAARCGVDVLTGMREVRAFGAEGRMLAGGAGAGGRVVRAAAPRRKMGRGGAGRRRPVRAGGIAARAAGAAARRAPAPGLAAHPGGVRDVGVMPRAGVLLGLAASAARRIVDAAELPPAVPEPDLPLPAPPGTVFGSSRSSSPGPGGRRCSTDSRSRSRPGRGSRS